ncbi:MAG: phosphatidate cytidylyltransferase [Methylotenera sp.]|nr:MAG: phosphatidate cytidylyltransferase [Methylotenera sp.]
MLKTRIITAIVLMIGFLGILFFASAKAWALLTLAATLVGIWEWANLIKLHQTQVKAYFVFALILGLAFVFAPDIDLSQYMEVITLSVLALAVMFWLLIAPVLMLNRTNINHPGIMSLLGLVLLFSTWFGLMGLHRISPWLLLSVLATVWIADTAAYFFGKRYGRIKLAPKISPGKTWEGVAGALFTVTLYGAALCIIFDINVWLIIGLWLIVVLSIMGDLFESLLKRQAGIKDSGQLLPGHGGLLDRIDGLIPSLALTLFYIYFPLFTKLPLHA